MEKSGFNHRMICMIVLALLLALTSSGELYSKTHRNSKLKKTASSRPSTVAAKSQKSKISRTASRKKPRKPVIQGQRSIEPSRVIEIQSALAAAGYYKATPSGQWDEPTSKAMSAYQQDNGFKTTGKPDALSLKKLGL